MAAPLRFKVAIVPLKANGPKGGSNEPTCSDCGADRRGAAPATARAQGYPTKPIKLVVPFPAGGPSDLFARALGNGMGNELGQQVVIENRSGAGGMTGVDSVAKSPPDGYTIGLNSASVLSAFPFMLSKMPFDWQRTCPCSMVIPLSWFRRGTGRRCARRSRGAPGRGSVRTVRGWHRWGRAWTSRV